MDDIEYRNYLQRKSEKLTLDEKKWLATHPMYSEIFGDSILRADCISIKPKVPYLITIKLVCKDTLSRITPTIVVPLRKGYIKTTSPTYDIDHVAIPKKDKIYVLSSCNSDTHPTSEMEYYSDLGCIEISYDCELTDHRGYKYWGTSKMIRGLGMQKEQVSDSKVIYRCNDVTRKTFDSYVFCVEWRPN